MCAPTAASLSQLFLLATLLPIGESAALDHPGGMAMMADAGVGALGELGRREGGVRSDRTTSGGGFVFGDVDGDILNDTTGLLVRLDGNSMARKCWPQPGLTEVDEGYCNSIGAADRAVSFVPGEDTDWYNVHTMGQACDSEKRIRQAGEHRYGMLDQAVLDQVPFCERGGGERVADLTRHLPLPLARLGGKAPLACLWFSSAAEDSYGTLYTYASSRSLSSSRRCINVPEEQCRQASSRKLGWTRITHY
jgi:hypothetical protein